MSTNLRSHLKESLKQGAIYSGISILPDDEEASDAQALSLHSRRSERSKMAKTEKVKLICTDILYSNFGIRPNF
jgi:ATP-dependent DNA ligase